MFQIFGPIPRPNALDNFGSVDPGLGKFLNLTMKILVVGAGVYALINLLLAGYAFMAAGDEPKKIESAWAKIWQTMIGLVFVAGAFVLAAIFGLLIYGDTRALLTPTLPTIP